MNIYDIDNIQKLNNIEKKFYCFYNYGDSLLSLQQLLTFKPAQYRFITIEIHYIYNGTSYMLYKSSLKRLLTYNNPLNYLWKLTDQYY